MPSELTTHDGEDQGQAEQWRTIWTEQTRMRTSGRHPSDIFNGRRDALAIRAKGPTGAHMAACAHLAYPPDPRDSRGEQGE